MRKRALRVTIAVAFGLMLGSVRPAHAGLIDFTNSSIWGGAAGQASFTSLTLFDGVQVTVEAFNGLLTFNSGDVNAGCAGTTGLACQGDGLGITDDEVTSGTEWLRVSFSSPVAISGLAFLDLFGYPNQSGDVAAEIARWYVYNPAQSLSQSATGTDTTTTLGYLPIVTNYSNVTQLRFYATEPTNSDFALASINVSRTAVPEPATLFLSGIGFVALATFRSRRRRS
jgi:hypothetical protein